MEDCERCFYLDVVKGVKRPFGIMAGIVMKMDSIIKHYFDKYRNLNQLPPIIDGKLKGKLPKNMPKALYYKYNENVKVTGKPDDYFELEDGSIVALDHKTKSKAPEETHPAYDLQMNVYAYLLAKNNYKTTNKGYLAYYFPDDCDLHNGMDLHCEVVEVKTSIEKLKNL